MEENQRAMEMNEERIAELEGTIGRANENAKAQREQVRRLEQENKDLGAMVSRRNKDIADLNKKLQVATSPSERKELEREIKNLKDDLVREKAKNAHTVQENEEKIRQLRAAMDEALDESNVEEREQMQQEINKLEAENERSEERNEEIFSRLSLKEKVKFIFKKYGVTVVGVLAAVGTVIGVIVSNLKAGLTKVAKGVGNGLKELGKKLAGILPGMVGAIVSFLFKTAGEAVGFLAKHAWLLILLVVTFVVEQYKE